METPNIILITLDQWRHDAMGCKNVFPVQTPNLDGICREGISFDLAYCSNPLCVPSRASLMTGLHSCETGVFYNSQGWSEQLPTLPGVLSNNGYYSLAAGKMHFNPKRRHGGFDKRVADYNTDYPAHLKRNGVATPPKAQTIQDMMTEAFATEPTNIPIEHYEPVYVMDSALRELEAISARRNCAPGGDEPFFIWVSFSLPHTPVDPPEPWFSMVDRSQMPPPRRHPGEPDSFSPELRRWHDAWQFLDEEWTAKIRAQYMGCVSLVDQQIGRLLRALDAGGLRENSLLVCTADHGDYLGDHGMQQKGFFHDASARVPLIFSGPGLGEGGQTCPAPVSLVDLFPTILEYCDLRMARSSEETGMENFIPGFFPRSRSLVPWLQNPSAPPDRVILAESGIHGLSTMAFDGVHKAVYYDTSRQVDLFDLRTDPDESHNLGSGLALQDLPEHLRTEMENARQRAGRFREGRYFFFNKVRPMFT